VKNCAKILAGAIFQLIVQNVIGQVLHARKDLTWK
jgi:hypothetical protein